MKTRFYRARSIEISMRSPQDGKVRGLFYDLILGVEAPVDPDSGMTLNLIHVEALLDSLESLVKGRTWSAEAEILRSLAAPLAAALKAFPQVSFSELGLSRFRGQPEEESCFLNPADPQSLRESRSRLDTSTREKTIEVTSQNGRPLSESEARGSQKVRRSFW